MPRAWATSPGGRASRRAPSTSISTARRSSSPSWSAKRRSGSRTRFSPSIRPTGMSPPCSPASDRASSVRHRAEIGAGGARRHCHRPAQPRARQRLLCARPAALHVTPGRISSGASRRRPARDRRCRSGGGAVPRYFPVDDIAPSLVRFARPADATNASTRWSMRRCICFSRRMPVRRDVPSIPTTSAPDARSVGARFFATDRSEQTSAIKPRNGHA